MGQVIRISLLSLLVVLPLAADASMRCDGRLMQRGDYAWELEQACGAPDAREPLRMVITPTGEHAVVRERWFYNPGPRGLVQVVEVRDGRVTRMSTAGHGYREVPGGPCRARELRRGMSRLELLARCGEPDHDQVLSPRGGTGPGSAFRPREMWVYAFSPGEFARVVTLEAGEVVRVERGSRTR